MTSNTRQERDTFGPIDVPADRLWGAQTQRSLLNFDISGERQPRELIHALARVKRASARVNHALGLLEARKQAAIVAAADEVIAGQHAQEFPLVVWQTGSGTQTNMNVNEVLANRASGTTCIQSLARLWEGKPLEFNDRKGAGALMRVNHVGEVCAQALYQGQSLSFQDQNVREALREAACEEADHLVWTEQRIRELGGRKSVLNPFWYVGALSLGFVAGKFGNQWSLSP